MRESAKLRRGSDPFFYKADARLHPGAAWIWLERSLFKFGGWTRDKALHEGWYLDPDTRKPVKDYSRRYVAAVPENKLARLQALLREATIIFRQKCIYLSVAGHVQFIKRTKS